MKRNSSSSHPGYTLVEICVAIAILAVVGLAGYAMLTSSSTLLAKNISLNSSNVSTRSTLDRIFSDLNQANRIPILINADGSTASGSGPAAGILVDRYVSGPFIVGNPGGGLSATATSFRMFYSTDLLASPRQPQKNDVVIMDGVTRALVASSTVSTMTAPIPSPTPTSGKMVTVTLQAKLGSYTNPPMDTGIAIPWGSTTQQNAYLVHREAFVVVPVQGTTGPAELRLYPDAEAVTDYTNPSNYIVLTRNIGTRTVSGTAENYPFSITTSNDSTFLSIAMRVEDQQYNKTLASKQSNDFNTFLRVDTMVHPRNIPSL